MDGRQGVVPGLRIWRARLTIETFPPDDAHVTRLLRCLVEQADGHAFVLMAPTGKVMWCNRGAELVLSIAKDDFVGRTGQEIFTDHDRAAGLDGLELAIAKADALAEDDRWHVRADGSTFWSSGLLQPLKDASTGELLGFGKIFRDRTDVKTLVELLEKQVEKARLSAERKDHAITKLSHELRNVIGGLRGAVDLLEHKFADEQRRLKFHMLMQQQLAVIDQLTQDLLEVQRAGRGKITLHLESLVLQQEARNLIASVEPRLLAHRLTLQLLAPPADLIVCGDRVRLHQILGNLLDNAIKYTPPEGRIWVKLNADDKAALIHVEDTGRGIPPDKLSSIFELFTQVDADASAGGLGVGLALVRELVSMHGGSVQAASKGLGQGSQFTVRLPLAGVAAAGAGVTASTVHREPSGSR